MGDTPPCDLPAAVRLAAASEAHGSTVRIFAVGEDGAETMLPTYEEALAEIAAAKARLVETGAPEYMNGRWDEDPRATLMEQIDGIRHDLWSIASDGGKRPMPEGPWSDVAAERASELRAERDGLLTLLDRIDCDGKSLPGDVREDIAKALDAARKVGWRRA